MSGSGEASCVDGRTCRSGNQRLVDFDGDGRTDFSFGERDFRVRSLRGNAVLRWEFRPGSALFFVWSQGRTGEEEYAEFDFTRDLDHLRGAPASNVFLIKASYWFNP